MHPFQKRVDFGGGERVNAKKTSEKTHPGGKDDLIQKDEQQAEADDQDPREEKGVSLSRHDAS
jgi:hypothetical protein